MLALVAESLGYSFEFARDGSAVTLSADSGSLAVKLTGLRREAGRRAREDWPMLVSEHLAHAVATAGERVDVCDLDQVRSLLRTRVEAVDEIPDPDPRRRPPPQRRPRRHC
ncbi:hypothetical protein [Nonomuraea rubra]|uniref:hypothetical protein n=1 Tax=Nonomuraea rubra TaxID=46180 RepID=UPI0031EE4AE8